MNRSSAPSWILAGLGLACASALAAPRTGLSPGEQPASAAPAALAKHGLCDAPRNADAFPSTPVAVTEGQCQTGQEFKATSPGASYGGERCGGYTTAFGPKGDLKLQWDARSLRATWAGEPLTAANCRNARIAAVAWGWRCDDASCTKGAWEKLGGPVAKRGRWNKATQACYAIASVNAPQGVRYATLNIDAIASINQGGQWVRQPVAATIHAESPNGKCPTTGGAPASAPGAAKASKAGA